MPTVHTARVRDDGEDFYFVSVDGREFMPVNRLPADGEPLSQVTSLFGNQDGYRYLGFARRWLELKQAEFGTAFAQ